MKGQENEGVNENHSDFGANMRDFKFWKFLEFFEKKCNKTARWVHIEVKAEGKLPFVVRKTGFIWLGVQK